MSKNIKLILVAALAASFTASAHDITNALVNSSGDVVRNGLGDCVETANSEARTECGVNVDVDFTIGANALFDYNKSVLRPSGIAKLEALSAKIKNKKIKGLKKINGVKVVGHTDSKGSVEYNQGLSERRAASVANYLVKLGIPAGMIHASGEGELNPVATNDTKEGRQKNRRVNIVVTGVSSEAK